jgi:hypothetical protein
MSGVMCGVVLCLCNDVWGMSVVICAVRVYVMRFEVCQEWFMLLSPVYVMKLDACHEWFMLLSHLYVMKFEICQQCFILLPVFM